MIDNGLLSKIVNEKREKDGFKVFDFENVGRDRSMPIAAKDNSKDGISRYFFKHCSSAQLNAEVLLSQVYARAGLKSAIYLPIEFYDGYFYFSGVISNDVTEQKPQRTNQHFKAGEDFCYDEKTAIDEWDFPGGKIHKVRDELGFYRDFLLYHKKPDEVSKITKHFSKEVARNMIKMRLFDVGAFNTDRHKGNLFFEFDENRDVKDIRLFDYGFSGAEYDSMSVYGSIYGKNIRYYNEFCDNSYEQIAGLISYKVPAKSRQEMINQFKTNESMQEFITTKELAGELEKVDIKGTAEDIRDTIGYEVDKGYVDTIDESFARLAEEVAQS